MKEKFLKLKEQVLQNKKKAATIGIAVLLLIGAGGYGIVALNTDNKETAKAEQVSGRTTVKKTDKKDVIDKKIITDKKTEDKKSSSDKKEVKNEVGKKEDKKESAKGNSEKPVDKSSTGSTGNSNVGNNSSQGSGTVTQPSTPKPEPTPQPEPNPEPPAPPVHIHNFNIPITNSYPETIMVEVTRCSGCNRALSEIALTESLEDHSYNHAIKGENGGSYSDFELQQTGNMITETIGYKCSCGVEQQ